MFSIIGADQKEYGPVSAEDVAQWIAEGRADGQTYAKAQPDGEWKMLGAYPEFAAALAIAPRRSPSATAPPVFPGYPNPNFGMEARDFEIGECLSRGRTLLLNNFGLLTSACTVIWLVDLVARYIPFVDVFMGGVLYGGLYLVYLKRIRGEAVTAGEAFAGFGVAFVQLLLTGFLTTFLTLVGCCFFLLPALYLKIAWIFSLALVIDKRVEFWTAMELSRKITSRVWFKVFTLAVIVFAPYILFQGFIYFKIWYMTFTQMSSVMPNGTPDLAKLKTLMDNMGGAIRYLQLAAEVVLLVTLPFALGALMYAYEALFGARPTPAA